MDDVTSIFDRYEEVRHRLPQVGLSAGTTEIASLLDIVGEADAFAFDAFGVLNVGEIPIEGAAERLNQLRARGRQIRILTNSARSEEHTSELQSLMRISYAVFCLKKKKQSHQKRKTKQQQHRTRLQ